MPRPYCDTCNNTGEVDCYCGGDFCACGQEEIPCPDCDVDDANSGRFDWPHEDGGDCLDPDRLREDRDERRRLEKEDGDG